MDGASSLGFSLPVWVNVLLGLIGLAGGAGALAAFFRANLAQATIDQLKENNEALVARVDFLESDNRRLAEQVANLERTNQVLETLARGTNELAEFQRKILSVEDRQSEEHEKIMAALEAIARRVG